MNKVIIIHLNGIAYQLEEDGYEALRAHLDSASRRLEGNPDRDEIIADIEHSIADKFRGVLSANKTVVMTREVQDVIAEMGPVQDDAPAAAAPGRTASGGPAGPAAGSMPPPPAGGGSAPKRLFRIREGAKIGGVCNGLAAYFGADVTLVRVLFAIVGISFGAGILLYVALMIIVPWAETPADIAAAHGDPSTTDEIIRRAKEGYYAGLRSFRDPANRRQWKKQFKREMRQHRREFRDTMRRNLHDWRQQWHHHWNPDHPAHAGWWVAYPLLGLLSAVVSIVCVASVLSLILTGSIFGILLPFTFPFWLQIVFVILVFRLISWPLKAMRYGYYSNGPYYPHPFAHLLHTVVWLGVLVFGVWLLDRHSPQAHEVLIRCRHEFHEFLAQVRDWWARQ